MVKERRLKFHEELVEVLGSRNVYWQPPESLKIKYPCIVYEEHPYMPVRANNRDYLDPDEWDVTVIRNFENRDETKEILSRIKEKFEHCHRATHFINDNLIHDVFQIYY